MSCRFCLSPVLAASLGWLPWGTESAAQGLSFHGAPGIVEMPSARMLPDGVLALSAARDGHAARGALAFQVAPRLTGAFRYAVLPGFDGPGRDRFDRSFDLRYQLAEARGPWPAVALGLRDLAGTGIYSGEYLVASRPLHGGLELTAGLGWGRLAGRGAIGAPLGLFHARFADRPDPAHGGIATTGQVDTGSWFRGAAAPFAGLTWQPDDHWTLAAEYSSDSYAIEAEKGLVEVESPFNVALAYRFESGVELGVAALRGRDLGLRLTYLRHPDRPLAGPGREGAPEPLLPRPLVAELGWNRVETGGSLAVEGMEAGAPSIRGGSARLTLENEDWPEAAQAAGRAARRLANTLPSEVERFTLTFARHGMPITAIHLARSDLERLEHALNGAKEMRARAEITDAAESAPGYVAPRLSFDLAPYTAFSFFDPDSPLRAELGVQLDAGYSPVPGLIFSGRLRQALAGNLGDQARRSTSALPHVRSDLALYNAASAFEVSHLTGGYYLRPGHDLFGRVTAGYLEPMYAGVSGELLWWPVDSPLALGVEVNRVRQRDHDGLFGLRDYAVTTGHASAYYDFGGGYHGQLDLGRYLAGDWGATLTLERRFGSGVSVGGFFTLTDVPFETFGEGSFDKGIRVEIPVSWLSGHPSRETVTRTIRPVYRDGGARLNVRDRLYDVTRDYRGAAITDDWGRFFR